MPHAASLIHASGVFVLPYWLHGACTVFMSSLEPGVYLQLLERERITAINRVPTVLLMLLDHPRFAGSVNSIANTPGSVQRWIELGTLATGFMIRLHQKSEHVSSDNYTKRVAA